MLLVAWVTCSDETSMYLKLSIRARIAGKQTQYWIWYDIEHDQQPAQSDSKSLSMTTLQHHYDRHGPRLIKM